MIRTRKTLPMMVGVTSTLLFSAAIARAEDKPEEK